MDLNEALILLFTHGIPILFFTYMATDVLVRNQRKTEHILLSLISVCYLLLFAEEYIRNQVSIEYSPIFSSAWLSSIGIIIPGLCFHFLIKFTRLDAKMPRMIYPYVFYLPLLFSVINIATDAKLISTQQFVQGGMWNLPVYNTGYYIAMTSGVLLDVSFLILLLFAKFKSDSDEQKSLYNLLIWGICAVVLLHVVLGYFNFGEALPPYPYLYSGIIWCYSLRHAMKRYDFINLYDKRFEKLFHLNPDAILLIDSNGYTKNTNPAAKQLFSTTQLQSVRLYELLGFEIKSRIEAKERIHQFETVISLDNKRLALLINADYVWMDNELHALIVIRDITLQQEIQEEIQFLAYHDPLTRLPNRRFFFEKLDEALTRSRGQNETVALLLIDLDRIKLINDTHGHLAGDETLQHAAQIVQETAGNSGVAARMGGDEFIMYISNSPTKNEIQQKIEQMQEKFARFARRYGSLPLGISVGVSYFPTDGTEGQALINIADNAMYEMKRDHANTAGIR